MGWKIFFHRGEKKVQNFQNFENLENLEIFWNFGKNSTFWHFEKFWNFEIFENFENFWDFENFEFFWDYRKFKKNRNFLIDFFFNQNIFGFFFDDLFRSQISPRFQKSHLENRVMSSKMWKSYFLRFWYTYTWPQGSDLAKIRLFDLWISKYSGKSQKNLRKKNHKIFFDRKNIFSQTYTIARFLICLHYEPKDYVKPKILCIRDFCAVTRFCWDFIAPEQCC